eukprot:TRINITY_DN3855_c0_g2_i2.p1 TRINITY_DN3855_c0_g2~~TRINITY_DN3855_c0_g2_i2.p1  ORF type:complete len:248 (+),score=59.99 TRINITY_DN3855_c0_g2_i2:59-802(+)
MKSYVVVILLVAFSQSKKCANLTDGKGKLSEDTCMNYEASSNFLYVKECEDQPICHIEDTVKMIGYCKSYIPYAKLPGEYCRFMQECMSGVCGVNNRCIGQFENKGCRQHTECDINLACSHIAKPEEEQIGVCVPLPKLGKDCVNEACKAPYVCSKGKCVEFGKSENGMDADNWRACKHFYVHEGKCVSEYELIENDPEKSICKYQYKLGEITKTFDEDPVCGNGSAAYCNKPRTTVNIENVISSFS